MTRAGWCVLLGLLVSGSMVLAAEDYKCPDGQGGFFFKKEPCEGMTRPPIPRPNTPQAVPAPPPAPAPAPPPAARNSRAEEKEEAERQRQHNLEWGPDR